LFGHLEALLELLDYLEAFFAGFEPKRGCVAGPYEAKNNNKVIASVAFLVQLKMIIHVECSMPGKDSIVFPFHHISPNDTVNLKLRIQQKEGVPPDLQCLIFNGIELEDDNTLIWFDVRHRSYLDLVLRNPSPFKKQVFVKTLHNKKFVFEVDPREVLEEVQSKIECKLGIAPAQQRLMFDEDDIMSFIEKHIQLHIKNIQGENIMSCTVAASSDDIAYLKMEITQKFGHSAEKQRLIYKGIQLEKGRTLGQYNIKDQDTIDLLLNTRRTVEVLMRTLAGKNYSFEANLSDTMIDLNDKIQLISGVPAHRQLMSWSEDYLRIVIETPPPMQVFPTLKRKAGEDTVGSLK